MSKFVLKAILDKMVERVLEVTCYRTFDVAVEMLVIVNVTIAKWSLYNTSTQLLIPK